MQHILNFFSGLIVLTIYIFALNYGFQNRYKLINIK